MRELFPRLPVVMGPVQEVPSPGSRVTVDPSVTDRWGRVWGHDDPTIADASLHVTNGGVNPVLALAYRVAGRFAEERGGTR